MILEEAIEGERLRLRSLDVSHATERYARWMADPEVNRYLESRFSPPDRAAIAAFIERVNASSDNLHLGIFLSEGQHIGNIKLGPIDRHHSRAAVGLMLGEPQCWGRGYASEAITLVSRYAFETLGLHKVWAGSYACNPGSIKAFVSAGWREEARMEKHHRCEEEWVDWVLLGLLNGNYAERTADRNGDTP